MQREYIMKGNIVHHVIMGLTVMFSTIQHFVNDNIDDDLVNI